MKDCYQLKPKLFYPGKFLIRNNNKLREDTLRKNSLSEQREITGCEEKRGTLWVFTFSDAFLWALALSLFYTLIQNVHCPEWPRVSYDGVRNLSNGRKWRNLSEGIPSHVKGFRRPHLSEDGEIVFEAKKGSGKDKDLSPEIRKIYDKIERGFPKEYSNMLTERDKRRCVENVMLFKNNNSEEMTDEELNERIGKLKGPVDTGTMLYVWNYVYDHERKKYIRMVEDMREACRILADYYNVPWECEMKKYSYAHDKMIKMLLKRENFEIKNIKEFATDEPICARWEFQRYLKLKQRSWADFTERMGRKWTNKLEHSFRKVKCVDIC
ncbi:Uncharacterized protein PCOAH_00015460 [Plasmodium coatneyi]|uniref:Plasmodium RESA N-terminal domain-containing protein n=1 Tax=Plasmodium coatneyi TaxID=208452 RepID=A0A1B1DXN2_9APIC|nr:Uncharacterized protein PCOAH_00015460 [Plasmodium coatneyi]ANQ07389.1 Uncharacterized protein PCOAH_00015460 [Plasmodium coatneyi]